MSHMFSRTVGPDLHLRLLETGDAPVLYDLIERCREYLAEWLPWVPHVVDAEGCRSFIESVRNQNAAENGFSAGIWRDRELLGVIGLHYIDKANRITSIGYWLGEQYQGQGIMTRSCRELVDYVFADLGLNRVEIRCAVANRKSRAIPERLNFAQEGLLREAELLNGSFVEAALYSVLAKEWPGTEGHQRGRPAAHDDQRTS